MAIGVPLGALAYILRVNFVEITWMPWDEVENPVQITAPENHTLLVAGLALVVSLVAAFIATCIHLTAR